MLACPACNRWFAGSTQICCPSHPDQQLSPRPLSGLGTIYSYTVNHVAMRASASEHLPYIVLLVATDEGPRVLAHSEPGAVRPKIGDRVHMSLAESPSADSTSGLAESHIPSGARIARTLSDGGEP